MLVYEYAEYRKSLISLRRKGGPYQKSAEKAIVIQDDLRDHERRSKLPITNNGETRIKKAVKYDLGGGDACRLVTIQDAGYIFLCFAGTHDDTDRWLEKNKGLRIRVESDLKPVATFESIDIANPDLRLNGEVGFTPEPLFSLIEDRLSEALLDMLPWKIANRISQVDASISDDEIEEIANSTPSELATVVFDVLIELRSDNIEGATRRVKSHLGELQDIGNATRELPHPELMDSSDFQSIRIDSAHYRELIEHFAIYAEIQDWMLFMHPDQQQYVDAHYSGPAKVSGVSGSGKTCVVVRRAIRLANQHPNERVLILTLNRSLASLIQILVNKAAPGEASSRIDVLPFFGLCQKLIRKFEPENYRLYDDTTWKGFEHIDEIWREFYRCEVNNHDARVLTRLHDSLIARSIDAESYIREEFDWIRSATTPNSRQSYLKMQRTGRTHPLDESFRQELLSGLSAWERKMRFVGVTDHLGIANALHIHIDKIIPNHRCVLIDECQDFGTLEIQLIRKLVAPAENDIFMCGDAAQQVSFKHQSLNDAGVNIPSSRSHKLILNYRNSRQILEAAQAVLTDNLDLLSPNSKDFEVLNPKYANFSGPSPLLLSAQSQEDEIGSAVSYALSEAASNPSAKICIAICGYTEHELTDFAKYLNLPILTGDTKISEGQVFISDLENTKGFEFQCMIVTNCKNEIIPNPKSPRDEAFRDLSRLYVAMTRARHQLIVSHSGAPSSFLSNQLQRFEIMNWADYISSFTSVTRAPRPRRLDDLRGSNKARAHLEMSGPDYLYTEHALGCPPVLIDKLRANVTGISRTIGGTPSEWKTIWQALKDTSSNVKSRAIFGPEGYRHFRRRFSPTNPPTDS